MDLSKLVGHVHCLEIIGNVDCWNSRVFECKKNWIRGKNVEFVTRVKVYDLQLPVLDWCKCVVFNGFTLVILFCWIY